jgi:glutamate synthase domain-containing protein 2
MRFSVLIITLVIALLFGLLGQMVSHFFHIVTCLTGILVIVGIWDLIQVHHSITRNYPILAHLRFLQELIRPEIHQYFIESDIDGHPYNRNQRSLVYQRAKNVSDVTPFGTELDVYGMHHEWLEHSMAPHVKSEEPFRTMVGGPDCTQPYSCSILNVSAMSFGALSPNAIMALNKGAKKGNFYHCTGEGGISSYHRKYGGDLVWQIGTGYFGCRNDDGTFNEDLFAEQAQTEQVRMIEIKISQGAKPGHGGVLPAVKITPEIAAARKIPMGRDCVSPPGHTAFTTPRGLCEFVSKLRRLSGGKPVGFKLCVGHRTEFLSVCKAMLETEILPDFITVDGAEGGTGAAPLEFSDSLGTPLKGGLIFVHNALVGCNLRDRIKIAAAGKVASAFAIARNLAIGADWCNAARSFMMSIGCIQAQSCHTNRCPVGVTTQDPRRYWALNVTNKSERAFYFHRNTMDALAEIVAAAGLDHARELGPWHICVRCEGIEIKTYDEAYRFLLPGELIEGSDDPGFERYWQLASADMFHKDTPPITSGS